MTHIGYGILRNDKPTGIWPINKEHAESRILQLRKKDQEGTRYSLVSVYIDHHVVTQAGNSLA